MKLSRIFVWLFTYFVAVNALGYVYLVSGAADKVEAWRRGYRQCPNPFSAPFSEEGPRTSPPNQESGVRTIYDAHHRMVNRFPVGFDAWGRRLTLPSKAKQNLLILGDSVSFGEGVRDEESFPSLLAAAKRDTRVINAAYPGFSLSDYLEQFDRGDLRFSDIHGPTDVLLVASGIMMLRNFCPSLCYANQSAWWKNRPRYIWDGQHLVHKGVLGDLPGLRWKRMLHHLPIIELLHNELDWHFSREETRQIEETIVQIKRELQKRVALRNFTVLMLPGYQPQSMEDIMRELDRRQISLVQLEPSALKKNLFACSDLLPDGHPSASGQRKIAVAIQRVLDN